MLNFIIGKVVSQQPNYIIVLCHDIGYTIFVANPFSYELNKQYTIYLYNQVREDEYSLYGFKSITEREMFLKLINVKGVGPKIALPILAMGSIEGLAQAIEHENILYLTKFPKVGDKLARQMILDLKGHLNPVETSEVASDSLEIIEVLSHLGYKNSEIKKVVPQLNQNQPLESQIKEALKLLFK